VTARDVQILELVSKGRLTWQIAADLNISERVVERHLFNVRHSLGAKTTPEAVSKWLINALAAKRRKPDPMKPNIQAIKLFPDAAKSVG